MKKALIYTTITALLFSYTGSAYLGNYSRLIQLVSAEYSELIMTRIGYFLQALGMFLFSFIFFKKAKKKQAGLVPVDEAKAPEYGKASEVKTEVKAEEVEVKEIEPAKEEPKQVEVKSKKKKSK